MTIALNAEYKYRFENTNDHKSINVIKEISDYHYENRGLTDFAQAMPDKYKVPEDPVMAYRRFYVGEKIRFAKWTKRKIPYWVRDLEKL